MASRMNRYHSNTTTSRSSRNESLYDSIYNEEIEYTNVEGIARIEKTNEIDIERIREMLKLEEEKKKKKTFQPLLRSNQSESREINLSRLDDKNYDIRDILNKAHEEKVEEVKEESNKELLNTQYNILKKIKLEDPVDNNLQDLIDKVNLNSKSNVDEEDAIGLLEDYDSTKTISDDAIKKIIAEAKEEIKEKNDETTKTNTIDTSFFTSSLNFNDDDFEELKEISDSYKRKKLIRKIIVFILFVALITIGILYYLEIIKF